MSEHHHSGPWAVWINDSDRDHNGQPYRLDVRRADERHVTEADAEWLRQVIRDAAARRRSDGTYTPSRAALMQILADELDAEARVYAEEAEGHPEGSPRRHALLGRILGKKEAAQRIRNIVKG